MTYCVGIAVDQGLVLCSDSRTHAGADQVASYGKMHRFGIDGQCQFVVLTAGNLATTQAVLARVKEDVRDPASSRMFAATGVGEVAEFLGTLLCAQADKHAEALEAAGFSVGASLIVGGQVRGRSPKLYMVYPQGNYITTSRGTPFLQIGEAKYGKPILDRILDPATSLDEAARCALVSMDSTMRSNATVGPPIELLAYRADELRFNCYRCLEEDDPYLLELRHAWGDALGHAFASMPHFSWQSNP